MWLLTVVLRAGILLIGPLPHTYRDSPVSIRLRPNITYARHGAESVVITPGTSAVRPQRALTSEQRLELLLTDLVPPTCALSKVAPHGLILEAPLDENTRFRVQDQD